METVQVPLAIRVVCVQLIVQVSEYCWSYCEQDGENGCQITGSVEMYAALKAELLLE
jgi:hypothetical protein